MSPASQRPPEPRDTAAAQADRPGVVDLLLRPFADIRAGEGVTALLMMSNVFLLLCGYYVIKTVREPLILATGGAELKAYAAAVQAAALTLFIPAYAWFSSRVDRIRLITGVALFFIVNIELLFLGWKAGVPYLGFAFFVWVGIYNIANIAQFWGFANDLYSVQAGERVIPLVAVGATLGAPLGALLAKALFSAGVSPFVMLQIPALILVLHIGLSWLAHVRVRRTGGHAQERIAAERIAGPNGFRLILQSRYLQLIAALLLVLNLVNTTGEYILGDAVTAAAEEAYTLALATGEAVAHDEFVGREIGKFYGDFFFVVNVATAVLQAVVASRLVRYLGIAGVLLAMPIVALGAYGLIGAGVGFATLRWAKTAENSTDYSLMNTAKAILWLPTTRAEKYKGKQAVDTFFVRAGDGISALLVWLGTTQLDFGARSFAAANVALSALALVIGVALVRRNRGLARDRSAATSV